MTWNIIFHFVVPLLGEVENKIFLPFTCGPLTMLQNNALRDLERNILNKVSVKRNV